MILLFALLLMSHQAQALPSPVTNPFDPCTVSQALQVLIPGAQWILQNNDYSTFQFVGVSTFTAPTQAAVNSQITACELNVTAGKASLANDISILTSSATLLTPVESNIVDVLKQKGLLTP